MEGSAKTPLKLGYRLASGMRVIFILMHVKYGRFIMKHKTKVISIAAVSGGGKTTVTKKLTEKLRNSIALYFDEYEFDKCPNDICQWIDNGANYNEWIITPFMKDVHTLLHHQTSHLDYILLDYPFAYLNKGMQKYIDLAVYIDTPLDIAMARRILRDFTKSSIEDVQEDLIHYLSNGRVAYLEMINNVKPNSDIVIDGSLNLTLIVNQILNEIRKREFF